METRDRHSLVSLAAPNELEPDEDPRFLRDEQVRPSPSHPTPSSLRPNLDLTRSPNPKPHLTRTLTLRLTLTPSLTQVSQIFFNCLVTELFVAATFNETSTVTAPVCVKNMTHPRWLPFGTLTRTRPPNLSNRARARALTRAHNLARARALIPSASPRPNPNQGGCPTRPSTT